MDTQTSRPCQAVVRPVQYCGQGEKHYHHGDGYHSHTYQPESDKPAPHQIVQAACVTEWTCHACGRTQDVSGEGAILNWMDCGAPDCGESSWLDLVP